MDAKQGDIVHFGNYNDQDIEWIVLEKQDDKVLVLSKNTLVNKRYHESNSNVTWESCTLREWLNSEFISEAFNSKEELLINVTKVTADKNPTYDTNPGEDQEDKIFLLSIKETEKYLKTSEERMYECQYSWWLRTSGDCLNAAAIVSPRGVLEMRGYTVNTSFGISPAMWINLNN